MKRSILSVWKSQISEASKTPLLQRRFSQRSSELFDSFAISYEQLRALPRRARRSLQRQLARSSGVSSLSRDNQSLPDRRSLQHKLAWSVAGAALLLALGQQVQAADITVNTTKAEFNPGDGLCSLSEAILVANNDSAPFGDCTPGSGPDTIHLPGGTHNILFSYAGSTGLPPVTTEIAIEGNRAKISRINTRELFRLMRVEASGDLTLNDVTLQGGDSGSGGGVENFGNLTINNSTITKNNADNFGGAIYNTGSVTLNSSTITKNTARRFGGGIYNSYNFTVNDSIITGNKTTSSSSRTLGGGAFNSGFMNIVNSLISKNTAREKGGGGGGGIFNFYGSLLVRNSTIEKNKAERGAGIYNRGQANIINSTISQNRATDRTPSTTYGVSDNSHGGGIYNRTSVIIVNSTISGNKADIGAGLAETGGGYLYNTTITKNIGKNRGGGIFHGGARSLFLDQTLISGNKMPKSGDGREVWTRPGFYANSYNIFGSNGDAGIYGFGAPGPTDIVPEAGVKTNNIISPKLADNGGTTPTPTGFTKTHLPVAGGPAVDAVLAPCSFPDDQRGVLRPQPPGGACDIGAVELEQAP